MQNGVSHRVAALAAGGLAAAGAACLPLPVPHTEPVTPAVRGVLHRGDGSPVVGARVAATDDPKDVACHGPGGRAVSDSSGYFQLPAETVRRRVYWLTLVEKLGLTSYWLCTALSDASDMPVARAYVFGSERGDAADCMTWSWEHSRYLACNVPPSHRRITRGGEWADSAGRGTYVIALADDEAWGYESRAFVQWVEPSHAGRPAAVRAVVPVPTDAPVLGREGSALEVRDGQWYVTLTSTKRAGRYTRRMRFELGPPGAVRRVPIG